ncbi:alpha/beta hydrolase-fold protein [Sphingomonas sp.]|uniref:carboxylesterase family protein n=1 Tax=Sphingomonas sp. TaxID=28214 RepID=UPI00286DD5B0|nr:alpha/beta hydrolase-fold protein [Sphingomonas sp.]
MITALAALALAAVPAAGQHPQPPVEPGGYAYLLHLPPSYAADRAALWPLLIFLHGSGERGDDLASVKAHGPPKLADRDPSFPFVLVSPQLPRDQDWNATRLDALLDRTLATLRIDRARVYLTGLSLGGHASWRWAAARPTRFAAVAPVAGIGDPATACALKETPVWAFHGDRDDTVPPEGSFAMVRAIRTCGGAPRLTIFPNFGHNSWDPAYGDPALYLWLLQQRRAPRPTEDQ